MKETNPVDIYRASFFAHAPSPGTTSMVGTGAMVGGVWWDGLKPKWMEHDEG